MNIKLFRAAVFLVCLLLKFFPSFGQLTGVKSIPGDYATVSLAVAAVNSAGVGAGGVTFNVAANYTETITATISLTATGTAANPILFQKDPSTSGANPVITAYTTGVGTPATAVQDGIWRLVGSDYVTIDGIDIKDNPSNTSNPSTMEYGYALYKANAADGCQFVTIKNCAITLSNVNNATSTNPMTEGSAGIIIMNTTAGAANVVLTPTTGGTNSDNKFYTNIIQNCNYGISLIGYSSATSPFTLADTNNDIGGSSAATGNTIVNYGGGSGATNPAAAIRTLAQYWLNVSYNTINNNNGSGSNHPATLRGILLGAAKSASASITNNTITLNGGATTLNITGIENLSGSTAAGNTVDISNNSIINSTFTTATTGGFYGINNGATPATLTINNNTIANNSTAAATTGFLYGVYNNGTASSVAINNNNFTGNSTGALTTGLFAGIFNSASSPALSINGNTLAGNVTSASTGAYYPIYNSGTVTTTLNINSNNIGTAISPSINFTAANSASQIFINNTKGSASAALSISNNNFYNVLYSVPGTGANTYISNTAATLSQAINNNTFTNLNVNTTGSITFIANAVIVSATGTQNVNSNSIGSSFTKTGVGGTLTLFTSTSASVTGSVINNNNNNFSNITVSGSTVIAGWVNTDAGGSTKTINNNTFSNWTGGTGSITAMSLSITGANNATTGNAINNISSAGTITGIATAAGNNRIYSNTIDTLVSSGTLLTTVNGISVTAGTNKSIYQNTIYYLKGANLTTGSVRGIVISGGTTVNAYQNTIYNLQGTSITSGSLNGISISGGTSVNAYQNAIYSLQGNSITTGSVNGISISGGTTILADRNKIYDLSSSSNTITGFVNGILVSGAGNITLRNNLVGDIRTPAASSTDPVRGIAVLSTITSAINIYNNTIYLNATSSGTNFGSTGIYHTTSTVATIATLDLRNNIIINTSVSNGTGLTVAYRRSSGTLTNYASTSNNNLFYAGLAAPNRLIFYDGTNSDQLLLTYKPRVSSRDAQSVTEDMISTFKFNSTLGSSSSFLHIDSAKSTQAESGGIAVSGVSADYDGGIRQGNTGYIGTGTAPDIGADEFEGIHVSALSGTYNVGIGQTFTSLTNADGLFANINSRGLGGNVIVNITSDLAEDGTNVLYQWIEQGTGSYTLTIQPDSATVRIISGNIAAGMIRLNGADRVIIDGRNNGTGNYLTFQNTNTAGTTGTAFTFINGATYNTIKYCNIEAYSNATNGVLLFSGSTIAGGNSNNLISNCNINATVSGNTSNLCIYSAGTIGKENYANTISNNNIYNYRDRALDITSTGSTSWTISGNSFYNGSVSGAIIYAAASTLHGIRILGGAGYSILNNYIGGNASLASGTNAVYSSTAGNLSYQAILLTTTGATPASYIKGNTIAATSVSSVPTSSGSVSFIGIESNGSGINIGGISAVDGNTIGSIAGNSSIVITTTTAATTSTSIIRGINCNSTGGLVTGNQVGGIDIQNAGAGPAASAFLGIYVSNAVAPSQVNNNIIGIAAVSNSIRVMSTSTATATYLTGILIGTGVTSNVLADGNIIQNLSNLTTTNTSGTITGISSGAATATANVTISNNIVSSLTATVFSAGTGTPTSSYFVGINNTGAAGTVRINNNTIRGFSTTSTAGNFNAIRNTGAVINTIQVNNNQIGTVSTPAITFNAAISGSQIFINNTGGGTSATLSISNNNFQGISYPAAGSGANTYILNSAATLSQAINGNTFTNLNINTTGAVTFISNSVIVPATGTQNVNSNSIAGTFNKTGAGTVTLFTSTASSIPGSVINNNGNNFSNITVTGAAVIAGWVNTDGGSGTKTIQNNTFSNWTGATGAITAMSVNLSGTNNSTTGNMINNISSAAAITGITTGAGKDNIYSNTINTLSTTGASVITGIAITSGTTKNIYKNKIYDLQANNATGTVNGILVSGTTIVTINVFNNLIGDLRTPIENSGTDAIRAISITATALNSAINVYYNTVYLNATSTGTSFGTSGIYHTSSSTATTASLNLRNNSITNTSTPKGSGLTVAFRRSSNVLTNYASTSNNNLFYAGPAGSTRLIYYDLTNASQTIPAFQTAVAAREALSVTNDLTSKFLSTTGSSAVFLHMDAAKPSPIESGAVNITGFTDDIDGQTRAGNPGYNGSTTSPDIGADEIFGVENVPPTITYTLLTNTTSTTNRSVTGVIITDGSGVNIAAGTKPRIYYKRFADANVWLDNSPSTNGWKYTEATNSASPFTFTIDYSMLYGGATVTAGAIQYFIVAQDIATTANIAINSGTFAAPPSTVALTSAAFPIGGTINSYTISFAGAYDVGSAEVFTSLTKANGLFAAINSAGLAGNVVFNITSDLTEDGTNALDQWTESGIGNYTVTIQPDAATGRTISGDVAAGLIRLNGADRVTIDGRNNGGGSYLSFKNTNTGGTGTAFTFINGATNNAIKYCNAEAFANASNGVVLFSTSSIAGGNSDNLIDNCTINATVLSNTGNVAIYSAGTVGNENSSDTISNNNIYGYRDRGLDVSATGSTAWTISGNSLYNGNVSGAINYAASSTLHGIRILGGAGYSLLNNFIGGNGTLASGANAVYASTSGNLSYKGIQLITSNALPASDIRGNTIAAILLSSVPTAPNLSAFTGIETNGSGINIGGSLSIDGNSIGSGTTNGSIAVITSTASVANTTNISGINCLSSGGAISNNHVGGFDISNIGAAPAPSYFQGIYVNNSDAPAEVDSNLVGSISTSNSIRVLQASAATSTSLTGIGIGAAVNSSVQVNNNRIENISNLSTTSSGSFIGINNMATFSGAVLTMSNDTIQYISTGINSNAGSTIYSGIVSSSAATISNNLINNIAMSSGGINAQITGLNISGSYATTVSGNIVSNFSTVSNKANGNVETGSPAGSALVGILNSTTAAGQIINDNRFSGFSATSTAGVNVVVTGIGMMSTGSGDIFNNRFGTMINLATGTAPAICHIVASSGSFNVYNNVLRTGNLPNTNAIKIYGIIHASATNWNYYHNSVKVAGTASGIALRSAAFLLSGNSSPVLKNNIFFNIRTGTGSNYAISNLGSPPSDWSSTASDYNGLYTINSNTVAEWGSGVNKTFEQWQSISGGDAHSANNPISFIITPYDLEPDSVTNCTFVHTGTPITTPVLINTDINGNPRNSVAPDLGAYEFIYKGFTVIAGSNSPVCGGDSVYLTANPGNAISPHFSWSNPANVVVSTLQNPAFLLTASGQYKVTVTDSTGCYQTDSTLVLVNQRPTATITSTTSVCDSGSVNLNIAVTGTGTINGTLSNGDNFSGTAPLIIVPVFVTGTTSLYITDLSDSTCTSIATDLPDTVTVEVTNKGDWLGITTNWHDPVNWCGGVLPTSSTDINIPTGTEKMPIITDSVYCKSLTINTGDTLTITGTGTLNIAGILTNFGTYLDNGTTNFNGTSGQQTFSGVTTFNKVMLNNTSGLLLPVATIVKKNLTISAGILNANNFGITVSGDWTNNASTAAFNAGTAIVTFNGTTAQVLGGTFATTFNNLTISNTGSNVTLNVNTSITGDLSVSSGTFNLDSFTANRATAGGILTVANNATLKIGGTNTYPTNYTINTLVVAGTVEYSGTNQTISNQTYGNLKLSSSSGAAVKTFPATALTVAGNFSSVLGTGTSVSFTAASNISINGNVSIGASTTFNGASYLHNMSGNWINNGTFNGNTGTITFTGIGAVVSGSGAQNFNNLTVAAALVSFSPGSITLTGNLTTTGSGSFRQDPGGTLIMSGSGTTISGAGISLNDLTISGSVSTIVPLDIAGNLFVNGSFTSGAGTITLSGVSKTISGGGTISFGILYVTGSITTNAGFTITKGLSVVGSFSASAGTATFTGTSSLGGTANLYSIVINGTALQLGSNSVLGIANTLTLTSGILNATTSGYNTVNFNGAGPQNINALTYSNLVLSNGNTKTAVGDITTTYDITIGNGTIFNPSAYTLSIYGNWINNGTFIPGTSSVQFTGSANAFIKGATTFNILTSNTSSSSTELLLQSNVSAAIVNMTSGIIETGPNTLTITNTRTGNGFIYGNIQRTHAFTTGIAYAFEGPDNTINFSAVSGVSSVTVSVTEGSVGDFPFGGSISRVYDISVPSGTYTATLRLHYEDDELNGHNESSITLWHYSSSWGSLGKTANDATLNYVEHSGLTDITNRWTLSDNVNLVQWNGSVSSDWNNADNWTVFQGSATAPPSASDIVDLGSATFTNQPTISNSVTVKSIIFGSTTAVTLTLAAGGSLTTLGSIDGDWMRNVTHTIDVNDQSLTVGGDLDLSDDTSGHAINLNIGNGTVTALASLTERGDANITFGGAGTLNIYKDFNYSSGTFTAGSGTVIYNGTENQHIAHINYDNLIINKGGGIATIDSMVNIAGNLLISSGQLDNFSTITVSGDVVINSGGIFRDNQIIHVGGNWTNNGTYVPAGSSVFFDGPGTQYISASVFGNMNIHKTSGMAIIMGNIIVNGDVNMTSGTVDLQTYFLTRAVPGGVATLGDSATVIIGGNSGPSGFSTFNISPKSTLIFNGPATQYLVFGNNGLGNVIFSNTGPKVSLGPLRVNGDLTISNGATLNATSYPITLFGNWINNGNFIPSSGLVSCNGIAKTISGVTTFNSLTISGSYTFLNDFTCNGLLNITNTGSLSGGNTIHATMNGDLINSGVLYTLGTTTFTGNVLQTLSLINSVQTVALTVNFNGSVSPVLNSSSAPQFGYLNINNTGGVNPSTGWNILYSLTVGNGASFNGGVATHNMLGSVTNNGSITSSGILNFIPTSAATVNLGTNFSSTGRVIFGGAGAMTMAGASPLSFHNVVISSTNAIGITPSSAWSMRNNFTVNTGSVFNAGNYVDSVGGKISNSGTINSGTSTFVLNGAGTQDIFTLSNFNNLTINKASGLTTLSSNATVNGVLNFITGTIQTGSHVVIQPPTGTLTGASQNTGWVNGNLQKSVTTGADISKTFEIGDSTYYTPATVLFANVSAGGNLTASTTPADHPQIGLSGINKNLDVNRYWNLNNAGIVFTTASSTFNWISPDIDAGATTTKFRSSLYDGVSWGFTKFDSLSSTSIRATALTSLGSLVIGEGLGSAIWTGAAGTADWFTAGNWLGGVPDTSVETSIPTTLQPGRVFPEINTGVATIDTMTIQNNATLILNNSTLQIKGAIINNGTFDAGNGTIEMTGTSAQTIPANTFANNALDNLIISNTSSSGVVLNGSLNLYGLLTYSGTGMKLNTNDSLTLKSTALNTATVGDMTGNTITGKVTVERYLTARKAWRFLSIPTNSTQTIHQTWQEGNGANLDNVPGFGTQITGAGGAVLGFDVNTAAPSMKTYISGTGVWAGVANTNSVNIVNPLGYMVFVRGARDVITAFAPPIETVLRTKGYLYTGDQTPINIAATKFSSAGNPYVSSLDFRNVSKTGLKDFFYLWDPNLGGGTGYGGYQTFFKNGSNYIIAPGGGSYGSIGSVSNYIGSGQAFLIQADSTGGSLTFNEGAKTNGNAVVSIAPGLATPQLNVSLKGINADNSTYMADGAIVMYDDGYSNNVNGLDAIKLINTGENLSVKTQGIKLVMERRATIRRQDTLFLDLTGLKFQKYRFEFTAEQLDGQGLTGLLEDTYLHTITPINLNGRTIIDFNIVNTPASYAASRFRVVFIPSMVLPITFTSIKAYSKNEDIVVDWKTGNEGSLKQFDVEKSNDGHTFTKVHSVVAGNSVSNSYNWIDAHPVVGNNFYRILSTDINGNTKYSNVVKVIIGSEKQSISVYPNPVTNGLIHLEFVNQPAGKYEIRLLNKIGQAVISRHATHEQGSSTETIQLDKHIAHGIYQLEVSKPDGGLININVIY